jgi:hypothetical protein
MFVEFTHQEPPPGKMGGSVADAGLGNGCRYGLEQLLIKYGVDIFLNGHEHNYERNWPTMPGGKPTKQDNINPTAPIYIVSGCAYPCGSCVR